MSVAVITSVYGSYDQLPPVPDQTIDAEWICVTDVPASEFRDDLGWRIVHEPRNHMHPRLAAKVAKCQPWLYTRADTTVWIDGACRLLRPDSLAMILTGAEGHPLAQIVHPWRDCIYTEAEASAWMPKYQGQLITEQVDHYQANGHPEGWGLWATGMIVRNMADIFRNIEYHKLGDEWLLEQMRWSYQDQLSQPYVLRRLGLRPHTLPFDLHGSGVFEWLNHRDDR